MNKSKAKRLRKELEQELRAADRGHAVQVKRIAEDRRRKELALVRVPKPLTLVQKAVHFEPGA